MEPYKCYGLNPERGTQYGWINNNAQDRYWWIEVSCGENLFFKKGYQGNAVSKDENSYDYIWHGKSALFYDASGRKTEAHPETRRFLFLPRRQ